MTMAACPEGSLGEEFLRMLGSTTIMMITGLLQPSAGEAFVAGIDTQKEPPKAKAQIACVSDTPNRNVAGSSNCHLHGTLAPVIMGLAVMASLTWFFVHWRTKRVEAAWPRIGTD